MRERRETLREFCVKSNMPVRISICQCLLVFALGVLPLGAEGNAASGSRPNILFILTDDLGYGDIGVFYQNERHAQGLPCEFTPNLDALAAQGVQLREVGIRVQLNQYRAVFGLVARFEVDRTDQARQLGSDRHAAKGPHAAHGGDLGLPIRECSDRGRNRLILRSVRRLELRDELGLEDQVEKNQRAQQHRCRA